MAGVVRETPEQNLVKSADLARVREVDFVYMFGETLEKLIEALGITRKIAKQAGTVLKYYKAVASVVKSYNQDVLAPMEEQINNALKSLNIDEEGVMVQKAQELYDSLFYYDPKWDLGGGERTFKMRENWEQILQEADLPSISGEYGESTVNSFNGALQGAISDSVTVAQQWMGNVNKAIHDSEMDYGSPSKTAIQYGLDTVLGFNQGISDNSIKTIDTVSSYMDKIKQTFSGIVSVFEEIGKMVMQGFESGISQMEGGLYDKANSIADNITQTIKSALEIHSPSRVMFKLGNFTMQGFKEGMENLYNPITESIKAFSYDVAVTPAPSFSDMYGGYVNTTVEYTPQHNGADIYGQSGRTADMISELRQQNQLLREQNRLLDAIYRKPTMEIGDLNTALARDSMYRGGNIRGGNMSRLAVAEEVYY